MLKVWLTPLCLGCMLSYAQLNVELIGNLDYAPNLNDIWGYVDAEGTEYALVGLTTGFSIVSLADPSEPQQVQFIPGAMSTWRDIKTWGDFAYVVTDRGEDGLLIVDLSSLPGDTAQWLFWDPDFPGLGTYHRAHNIWIDEYGLAYLAGSNIGGAIIVDVKPDPWDPVFLASMPLNYAHDVYARDSIVYTSEIFRGQLRVYDITNMADIQLLGFVTTPFAFTHNAWLSDDGMTIFTTDERANAFIGAFDVSDPSDIRELDRFRPNATLGLNVIPHNVHVWNDFLIISYYTDGCIIVDASRPSNLIEVGNFDTYLQGHGGFSGAWGAYPFLPSGNILISDMQNGLFVLGPTYVRACFLEGIVVDTETSLPINSVQVEIVVTPGDDAEVLLPVSTDVQGIFKTGKAVPGVYTMTFSHPDYITYTLDTTFVNGEVLDIHVALTPRPRFTIVGAVRESVELSTVPFAHIALVGEEFHQVQADADGQFVIFGIREGEYRLYAGNWGYFTITTRYIDGSTSEDILVAHGYYDDFLNDLGWAVSGTSQGAHWVRDIPVPELIYDQLLCNPAEDLQDDFGDYAYMTGNAGGFAEDDSVLDGFTLLSSPPMDLTQFNDPVLSYTPWLCEMNIGENVFYVLLSDGVDTVRIDSISPTGFSGEWQEAREVALSGFLDINDQMQVHFLAQEFEDTLNVVKAAVDVVRIFDASPSSVKPVNKNLPKLHVYPNPANDIVYVRIPGGDFHTDHVTIVDLYGRSVLVHSIQHGEHTQHVSIASLHAGLYIVCAWDGGRVVATQRVVIQ